LEQVVRLIPIATAQVEAIQYSHQLHLPVAVAEVLLHQTEAMAVQVAVRDMAVQQAVQATHLQHLQAKVIMAVALLAEMAEPEAVVQMRLEPM
jgi:hypothetical protein